MSHNPITEFGNLAISIETLIKIYKNPSLPLDHPYRTKETLENKLSTIDHKITELRDLNLSKTALKELDSLVKRWAPFKKELNQKCEAFHTYPIQEKTPNLLREAISSVRKALQLTFAASKPQEDSIDLAIDFFQTPSEEEKSAELLKEGDKIRHRQIQITGEIEALEWEIKEVLDLGISEIEKIAKIDEKRAQIAFLNSQFIEAQIAFSELLKEYEKEKALERLIETTYQKEPELVLCFFYFAEAIRDGLYPERFEKALISSSPEIFTMQPLIKLACIESSQHHKLCQLEFIKGLSLRREEMEELQTDIQHLNSKALENLFFENELKDPEKEIDQRLNASIISQIPKDPERHLAICHILRSMFFLVQIGLLEKIEEKVKDPKASARILSSIAIASKGVDPELSKNSIEKAKKLVFKIQDPLFALEIANQCKSSFPDFTVEILSETLTRNHTSHFKKVLEILEQLPSGELAFKKAYNLALTFKNINPSISADCLKAALLHASQITPESRCQHLMKLIKTWKEEERGITQEAAKLLIESALQTKKPLDRLSQLSQLLGDSFPKLSKSIESERIKF